MIRPVSPALEGRFLATGPPGEFWVQCCLVFNGFKKLKYIVDLGASQVAQGEGNGHPLQYSCLGYPMDRGAWWATVHRVVRVRCSLRTKPLPPTRWLSDKKKKKMPASAGDSGSIPGLVRSPGEGNSNLLQYSCLGNPTEEPGVLQSMRSQKSSTQLSD